MEVLSVSSALQIAGRAGRYGTVWDTVSIILFISINITKEDVRKYLEKYAFMS